jgi:hypothetical protein
MTSCDSEMLYERRFEARKSDSVAFFKTKPGI